MNVEPLKLAECIRSEKMAVNLSLKTLKSELLILEEREAWSLCPIITETPLSLTI